MKKSYAWRSDNDPPAPAVPLPGCEKTKINVPASVSVSFYNKGKFVQMAYSAPFAHSIVRKVFLVLDPEFPEKWNDECELVTFFEALIAVPFEIFMSWPISAVRWTKNWPV